MELTTNGVYKPSAGTTVWGYGNFWVSAEDAVSLIIHGEGFAYSDYSIQNGVRCGGTINGQAASGLGDTNGGDHIAGWALDVRIEKRNYAWNCGCDVRFCGETTSYWGFNDGNTTGDWNSPLGYAAGSIYVPALTQSDTPPAPTVTGSGNSRTITCPATNLANNYRLLQSKDGAAFSVLMNVNAGQANTVNLDANSKYSFCTETQGYNGVWVRGGATADQYSVQSPPIGLTASASGTSVALVWSNQAKYATGSIIERSTLSDFSTYTQIYSGNSISTYSDTPPITDSGTFYYRVKSATSGGYTTYSNVVSATTMVPPAAPTALARLTPYDSNTVSLSWTDNPTTLAPYGFIKVQYSEDNTTWNTLAELGGTATSYSYTFNNGNLRQLRLVVGNAAGSTISSSISVRGRYANPTIAENSIDGVTSTVRWNTAAFPSGFTASATTQIAIKATDGTYSDWVSVTPTVDWNPVTPEADGHGIVSVVTTPTKKETFKLRCQVVITDGNIDSVRTSDWIESPDITVALAPPAAVLSYNSDTLIATISQAASISIPRDIVVSVGNSTILSITDTSGSERTDTVKTCVASKFTIKVVVSSPYWDSGVETTLDVDLDTVPFYIGGKRYLGMLVGETVKPCAWRLVKSTPTS